MTHLVRAAVAAATLMACTPGPVPLAVGERPCDHCHMVIMDPRFGGELVTSTGKIYQFDDIGCLAEFVASGQVSRDEVHSVWVSDFRDPATLLDAASAVYLEVDSLRTPMGSGLAASAPGSADSFAALLGGERRTWAELVGAEEG